MARIQNTRLNEIASLAGESSLATAALIAPAELMRRLDGKVTPHDVLQVMDAARNKRDELLLLEKSILTHASPVLPSAVRLGLRHPDVSLQEYEEWFGGRASRYTRPGSVSSMFSPAAYLCELYREARTLYQSDNGYHIDCRRPDLQSLVLSQENMETMLPALALSNEILMAHARTAVPGASNDSDVLEYLSGYLLTGSTPYHHHHARLRQVLQTTDPDFSLLSQAPEVTKHLSGASLTGMAFNIPPALYELLTEQVTAENNNELYTKYFGDIPVESLLHPRGIRTYFGLTDEEVTEFIGSGSGGDSGGDEYVGENLVTTINGMTYRIWVSADFFSRLAWVRIYPLSDGRWKLKVKFNFNNPEHTDFAVQKTSDSPLIICEPNSAPVAGMIREFTLPEGTFPDTVLFSLWMQAQKTGADNNLLTTYFVNHKVEILPSKIFALKLNKAIRLYKATGLSPQVLEDVVNSVNPDQITDETLSVLFRTVVYMKRFGLSHEDALVMAKGLISPRSHGGESSQFDRLFNSPPLVEGGFAHGSTQIFLTPDKTGEHAPIKATLKRAYQTDDGGLYHLKMIYDTKNELAFMTINLTNISALYTLSLWARVLGLTPVELRQVAQVCGLPDSIHNKAPELWYDLFDKIQATVQWLRGNNLSVGDLVLLTRTTYDTLPTAEIAGLRGGLRQVVTDNPATGELEARIALLAPHLAPLLMLPSADQAADVLTWAHTVKPGGLDVGEFWAAAGSDAEEQLSASVQFCYGLAQLALIYHASGITPDAFRLFIVNPRRLLPETPASLPRNLSTVVAMTNFSRWLGAQGEKGATVMSSLDAPAAGHLTADILATAMGEDPTLVTRALVMAHAHQQTESDSVINSWKEIEVVIQWLTLSRAFAVSPDKIGQLISLDYTSGTAGWAEWVATADAFSAGLKTNQIATMEAGLLPGLSAALSGFVIREVMSSTITKGDRESLYQYLLLDNLNGPQIITSRIAEAISSLQTFIQRTLSSPEESIGFEEASVTTQFFVDWEMINRRYSTWAGARKLVYYPENYVDPTVRLGQTRMMDEMLQTLGQAQINTDTVGDAFNQYLSEFEDVANLRVVSAYHDNLSINEGKSWFIGVTQSTPPEYYWRSADEARRSEEGKLAANAWTDWRKITSAPQPWQDCICPVIYKSRLYLCWLERQDVTPSNPDTGAPGTSKVWRHEVRMSYLRYDGNWSTPKVIDITPQVSALSLSNEEAPGLYCTSYQSETTMAVLVYKKPAGHDDTSVNGMKKHLLYVYEDMTFNHQGSAAADTFVTYMKYELNTAASHRVPNAYAQGFQTEQELKHPIQFNQLFTVSGSVSEVVIEAGASEEDINMRLKPVMNIADFDNDRLRMLSRHLSPGVWNIYEGISLYRTLILYKNNQIYMFVSGGESLIPVLQANRDSGSGAKIDLVPVEVVGESKIYSGDIPWSDLPKSFLFDYLNDLLPGEFSFSAGIFTSPSISTIGISISDRSGTNSYPAEGFVQNPPTTLTGTYVFNTLEFSVTKDWGGRNELLLGIRFETGAGSAEYTLRLYRSAIDPHNVIILGDTPEKAQYMESGPYRTRLNTLFARQLVERAEAGIDTILSYETQEIQEPQPGPGFYTTLTLPRYNPAIHGDENWVKIYYTYFFDVGDKFLCWSGRVNADSTTDVTIFVPCPEMQWVNGQDAHLQVSYKNQENTAASHKSVWYRYDRVANTVAVIRPGVNSLDQNIVAGVSAGTKTTEPMDFSGANALYFWELFYYTPMMVAHRFQQEQRFDYADQWLRYVWSPSGYVVRGSHTSRMWNVRPLEEDTAWNDAPLKAMDPDAVAQNDPMHYKVATFMNAIDQLIARGDAAYRRMERDTLTEAKVWYTQALNLLGERPYIRDNEGWVSPSLGTAASASSAGAHLTALSLLSNTDESHPVPGGGMVQLKAELSGATTFLPEANDVMLGYWQSLSLRMYNLRNNLTLDGQPLSLPLFATPADPKALLAAAVAAAGGGNASPQEALQIPAWRFQPVLESARSLTSQLIQFGNTLQGILERQDAEALNILLQTQGAVLMAESIRLQENTQAELNSEKTVLARSLASARSRFESYSKLYDENINVMERIAMEAMTASQATSTGAKALHMAAAASGLAPNIFGLANGGMKYEGIANAAGIGITIAADALAIAGSRMSQEEQFRRRRQEWEIQRNNAEHEMKQIEAQIATLEIRRESASLQKAYLETQQKQSLEQLTFLQGKFTSTALYSWLRGRLSTIYFQFYDLTVARCMMAERVYNWETEDTRTFIRGGWQGAWAGLTCGEGLMLNLAQMEQAWMIWHRRTMEVTRTVSLADFFNSEVLGEDKFNLHDAVVTLLQEERGAGTVTNGVGLEGESIVVRAALDDLKIDQDYPESFGAVRRIKQISVSLPALLGPYQDVRAVLNLTGQNAATLPPGCDSMVISRGMNDSGMFQPDMNDMRWLPFEGARVGEGGLALTFPDAKGRQQELLSSLSDIILHISYTIRQV
ncbi:neuraminidase-like domain-containing protein [Enterobacter ludwigii]|uniref:Tc toxin subunit A-related protein n=1 Tax=Enterobacter ludwigii TaxID=299767 RepID=UPI002B4BC112|nr:neuraminidase-like domain-containing protein [Enterobacter ludwigii]WRM04087.1 neuraminidase-like domain-containing protein [Enterobacter ludwigii]